MTLVPQPGKSKYPLLVYPQPPERTRPPASDLHPTSGLAGNWALDFMAPGGTPVVAPEAGVIWRLSGHDPALGEVQPSIFGWSLYIHTPDGALYFATHLGERHVKLGQKVKAGQSLGHVGHWPRDEPRSHTHLGVTHPRGITAAKARIIRVSRAPMVAPR